MPPRPSDDPPPTPRASDDPPPTPRPSEPTVVAATRRTSFVVVLATWALLIVTLPLYFTFLLFNLPDVLTILSTLRALPTRTRFTDDDSTG